MSLRTAAACPILVLLCCTAQAEQPKAYFTLHEVGKGVWAAVSSPGSHAGGNTGFVVGSDGVAVIDTFETPEAAEALLAAIRKITPLPVRFAIDTHYHLDHVGGNVVFAKTGAVVLAQENVRAWERTENLKFFGDAINPEQREMVESLVLPTVTYRDGVVLWLGDRRVVVRAMPGHTGSDSVVVVPDADVVFTGDLFWNHDLPNLVDADTAQQIATDNTLEENYPRATFVPGHGEVGKGSDVADFRGYLAAIREAVANARSAGKSGEALLDVVVPKLKKQYGTWGYFEYFSANNVKQTEAELAGSKRRPIPVK